MESIWIIEINWCYRGDGGHEILSVTNNKDNAIELFKKHIKHEKEETFLKNFFTNGKPIDGIMNYDYEKTDMYFRFDCPKGDCFVEISAMEKEVITEIKPLKKYEVTLHYHGSVSTIVEATSEEEAINIGKDIIDTWDDDSFFKTLELHSNGNHVEEIS